MPDEVLAKRLGVVRSVIFYKRTTLRVAPFRGKNKYIWRQKDILLLGKNSDQEVAKTLGTYRKYVTEKRQALGIEAFAYQSQLWRRWSEEELAMLGSCTDKELAERLNLAVHCVTSKRHGLGIKAFHERAKNKTPRPNSVQWTRRNLALLGKYPDQRVAEMMGIGRKSVLYKRKILGIESYALASGLWHEWSEKEIARLGTMIDRELASKLGVSAICVTTKRTEMGIQSFMKSTKPAREHVWKKRELALLGKKTDREVSSDVGLSLGLVRKKRIQLGIAAHFGSERNPDKWTASILARLSKESHQKIAAEMGISWQAVQQKCKQLGIERKRSVK